MILNWTQPPKYESTPIWSSYSKFELPLKQISEKPCLRWKHSPETIEELLKIENFLDLLCSETVFFHNKKPSVNDLMFNKILSHADHYKVIGVKTITDYRNAKKKSGESQEKPILMVETSDSELIANLVKPTSKSIRKSSASLSTPESGLWIRSYVSCLEETSPSAFDGLFLFDTSTQEFEAFRRRVAITESMINSLRADYTDPSVGEDVIFFWNYEKNSNAPLLDCNPTLLGVRSNRRHHNPYKIEVYNNMSGNIYNVPGQAGAVGDNAHAHDMTFNHIGSQIEDSMDLSELANQLAELRQIMKKESVTPENEIQHEEATLLVGKAEQAARAKDASKVAEYLKAAGKFTLDFASKVGAALVAEALKAAMGMK